MASYIVRLGPTEPRAHELIGIFVADTVDQLFELVNETELPLSCEYRTLGNGGIYWDNSTGHAVPHQDGSDKVESWYSLPPEPVLSCSWESAFTGDPKASNDQWQQITPTIW